MDVRVKLTGAKEIDQVLRGLPVQVNHKIVQQANASAAKALVTTAKLSAPEGPTGNLVDSIGVIKTPISKATELGLIEVGPRRGRYKGHAGHLVEYGTRARYNKSGAHRGVMPRRPFMEPSWERTKDKVLSSINDFIGKHLWNFMRKTING